MTPAWRNFFENSLTVKFDHRIVAYTIWLVAMLHALDAWRSGRAKERALTLAVLVMARRPRSASSRCCIRSRCRWR